MKSELFKQTIANAHTPPTMQRAPKSNITPQATEIKAQTSPKVAIVRPQQIQQVNINWKGILLPVQQAK